MSDSGKPHDAKFAVFHSAGCRTVNSLNADIGSLASGIAMNSGLLGKILNVELAKFTDQQREADHQLRACARGAESHLQTLDEASQLLLKVQVNQLSKVSPGCGN